MSCHEPHQSDEAKLLTGKVPDLCFDCHRRSKFVKVNIHPPVAEGKCLLCHEPHSARYLNILRAEGNEVCRDCHPKPFTEKHAVTGITTRGHKIKGKRDPARKNNPFGCSSCHDPHSSNSIHLFRFEAKESYEICINCHKK
jgi:predicted CXXCH cytochrome family protein